MIAAQPRCPFAGRKQFTKKVGMHCIERFFHRLTVQLLNVLTALTTTSSTGSNRDFRLESSPKCPDSLKLSSEYIVRSRAATLAPAREHIGAIIHHVVPRVSGNACTEGEFLGGDRNDAARNDRGNDSHCRSADLSGHHVHANISGHHIVERRAEDQIK